MSLENLIREVDLDELEKLDTETIKTAQRLFWIIQNRISFILRTRRVGGERRKYARTSMLSLVFLLLTTSCFGATCPLSTDIDLSCLSRSNVKFMTYKPSQFMLDDEKVFEECTGNTFKDWCCQKQCIEIHKTPEDVAREMGEFCIFVEQEDNVKFQIYLLSNDYRVGDIVKHMFCRLDE